MNFQRLIDMFIHPDSQKESHDLTKVRILVLIALSYFAASLSMLLFYDSLIPENFLDPIIVTISLVFIRCLKNAKPVIYISLMVFFIVNTRFVFVYQDIYGIAMHWYSVIVIAAMFLAGPNFGIAMATLSILVIGIFLKTVDYKLIVQGTSSPMNYFLEWCLTIIMTTVFAFIYEKSLRNLVDKVFTARTDLEKQRIQTMETSKLAALGEMAGGIAHEINNPLAIISGNSDCIKSMLKREVIEKDKVLIRLEKISQTVDRIRRIIMSMKKLSRRETSNVMETIDIGEIIREVSVFYQEKLRSKGHRLIVEVVTPLYVHCDQIQIGQVFINLLNNAFDALEENGQQEGWVKIVAREDIHHGCEIYISNSGQPIDKELATKIMNPFFTTKESGKGTGLGLSISKSIIEQHGGELSCNPNLEHTTFVLYLPTTPVPLAKAQ